MARPCCDPCCQSPDTIYVRLSSACACVDGVCITLVKTDDFPRGCAKWVGLGTSNCAGKPIVATLRCCLSGCMGSDWEWDPPGKLILYGPGTLDPNWTCVPFAQTWTDLHWDGDVTCVGVPITAVISEVAC